MDSNGLPMVPDLNAFPRIVRLLVLGTLLLFVGVVALAVLIGVLGT